MLAPESELQPSQEHKTGKIALVGQYSKLSVHSRLVFALIIAAVFLDVVDFSIIQVALPSIRTQFLVSLAESQWIVGAYGITMAGFLLLSGRAGDIYGQKKLFISGIVLFTIASMVGGFAPSLLSLVISRRYKGLAQPSPQSQLSQSSSSSSLKATRETEHSESSSPYYQRASRQGPLRAGSSQSRSAGGRSCSSTSQSGL